MEILGAIISLLLITGLAVISTLVTCSINRRKDIPGNRIGASGIGEQSKAIEAGIDKQRDIAQRNKKSIDNIEKLADGIGKSDSVTQDTIARTDSILQKIRTRPHTDNSDNK